MPIYKGNTFIERLYKGNELQRRVYKGNELVYGLYNINYHNKDEIYNPSMGEINEYAWGLKRNIAPSVSNLDFDDYFDSYKSHWYGWYDDSNYNIKRIQDGDQFIIAPYEHEDLDLYAKWKQKKFSYDLSYTINSYGVIPGGSGSSAMANKLAIEAKSHSGQSRYEVGAPSGLDWCAWFVHYCLNRIGYPNAYVGDNYADTFYTNIMLGNLPGRAYINSNVNSRNGNKWPNMVINESDVRPGDIICVFDMSRNNGWYPNHDPPIEPWASHVVIAVENNDGYVKVVGGNENGKVSNPYSLSYYTYWGVARIDFGDSSANRENYVSEVKSHLGEKWGSRVGYDWCGYYVASCLQSSGFNIKKSVYECRYARNFYIGINLGEYEGETFISQGVSNASGGKFSNKVIAEKDLIPGDIVCSWDEWNTWEFAGTSPPQVCVSSHVVTVVSVENGKAMVIGGNEDPSGQWPEPGLGFTNRDTRVNGPHDLSKFNGKWCVARLDFGDGGAGGSTINESETINAEGDGYDQNNPKLPEDLSEIIEGNLNSNGSISVTVTINELSYITFERVYDYNTNNWSEWSEVDRSSISWYTGWGEE